MNCQKRWFVSMVLGLSLGGLGLQARNADAAGPSVGESTRRSWPIGQFSSVELVARESDGPDNQHPADWPAELLRTQLSSVRTNTVDGPAPLFAPDELGALVVPLSQALALAKPNDDVLLLSTHRRGGPFFLAPLGITARLFVQDGSLQLIVRDARLDFYNTYIGSRVEPQFTFGSRSKSGSAVLQSAAATSRRGDWLALSPTAAAPAAAALPAATAPVAPRTPAVRPAEGTTPSPQAALPAPAEAKPRATTPMPAPPQTPKPRDPGFAEEIEQRLITLKRLRDKGLISEEEYQQKRKDVLQLL